MPACSVNPVVYGSSTTTLHSKFVLVFDACSTVHFQQRISEKDKNDPELQLVVGEKPSDIVWIRWLLRKFILTWHKVNRKVCLPECPRNLRKTWVIMLNTVNPLFSLPPSPHPPSNKPLLGVDVAPFGFPCCMTTKTSLEWIARDVFYKVRLITQSGYGTTKELLRHMNKIATMKA